jgi:hypothetical protein
MNFERKGDSLWQFPFYFISDELSIDHNSYHKMSLMAVNQNLPRSIDAAFNDGKFIFLFKGFKQFRTEEKNFPVSHRIEIMH